MVENMEWNQGLGGVALRARIHRPSPVALSVMGHRREAVKLYRTAMKISHETGKLP